MSSRYSGLSLSNRAVPGQAQVWATVRKPEMHSDSWWQKARKGKCVFSQRQTVVTISYCHQGNQGLFKCIFQNLGQFHSKGAGRQAGRLAGWLGGSGVAAWWLYASFLPLYFHINPWGCILNVSISSRFVHILLQQSTYYDCSHFCFWLCGSRLPFMIILNKIFPEY